MSKLNYLTVQDVLWINQEVTRKTEKFDFARLEEAVFYQYALGNNAGLAPQASRLLSGFLRMKPFEVGNEKTAVVACAAFLRLNGKVLEAKNSGEVAAQATKPGFSVEALLSDAPSGEHLDAQGALRIALEALNSDVAVG